ncbi:MAG: dipeptidase PepE [Candidatus Kerfeldbacteria bacterium]|nr:dipeptidase PepE [Candidatus Kerfeldbacteria bacterium]
MEKQLFLISSSRSEGSGYLEHCSGALQKFLGPMAADELVIFIPYALKDHDGYGKKAADAFTAMGYNLVSAHTLQNSSHNLLHNPRVKAVFVGGGNTFRLLRELETRHLLGAIKNYAQSGGKYIGSNAGSNMACPSIKTTNDMPIVQPLKFDALELVDFQINPHFVPGNLVPGHMGETRETRINEFHEENDTPVIGLTETNWITVDGKEATLHGKKDAFIFERNKELRMWQPETVLQL